MSRLFDDGSSQHLRNASTPITGPPFVLACWAYTDDLTLYEAMVSLSFPTGDQDWFQLNIPSAAGGDSKIRATVYDEGSEAKAISTLGVSVNTWFHACGIFATSTDRRAFLNGGNKGTNSTDKSPDDIGRIGIGCLVRQSITQYWSGRIAEVAIWDLTNWPGATGSDKADNFEKILPSLAARFSPEFFKLGLVCHWRLIRDEDQDIVGGYNMTDYNSPTIAAHPRIIVPTRHIIIPKTSVVIEELAGAVDTTIGVTGALDIPILDYTMGDYAALPSDEADLENEFSEANYTSVEDDDEDRVPQTANGEEFSVFQFRDKFDAQQIISVSWNGQSSQAPSESPVYLQIYNYNSNLWETLDSESAADADTDFDLEGNQSVDLSNYFNDANWISCRIYQESKFAA